MKYLESVLWSLDNSRIDEFLIGAAMLPFLLPVLLRGGVENYLTRCDATRADETLFLTLCTAVVLFFAAVLIFSLADQLPLLPVLMAASIWARRVRGTQ